MRSQRLLRTSSTQGLCIFCACRLSGDIQLSSARALLTPQIRTIANTRPPFQSTNAAAAPSEASNNDGQSGQSAWTGFDPNSTLSASEQREKAMLRMRREEEARKRQEYENSIRRANEERTQPEVERARIARQQREHEDAAKWQQQSSQLKSQNRQGGGNVNVRRSARGPGDGGNIFRKEFARNNEGWVQAREEANDRRAEQHRRLFPSNAQAGRRDSMGWNNRSKQQTQQKPQPQRVAMPNFLTRNEPAEPSKLAMSGWGIGGTERPALEYVHDVPQSPAVQAATHESHHEQADNASTHPAAPPAGNVFARPVEQEKLKEFPTPAQPSGFGLGRPTTVNPSSQSIRDILNVSSATSRDLPPPQASAPSVEERGQSMEAQPAPPSTVSDHQAPSDSRYHATPFNARDYRPDIETSDAEPQDNWQHLRPKQAEPTVAPQQQQYQPPAQDDDAWIDQRFAEYRQERDTRNQHHVGPTQPPPSEVQPQTDTYNPFTAPVNETRQRKCGRCGEVGHVARECTGPMRATCNSCGQVGHIQRDCPLNAGRQANGFRGRQQAPEQRQVERDFGSYRQPFRREGRDAREQQSKDPRQVMMERARSYEPEESDDEPEMRQEPTERVLKSRKFRDVEEPETKKPSRRGRRYDEDGDDDRPSRRGRRGYEDDEDEGFESMRRDRQARKAGKKEQKEAAKKAERAAERAAQQAERAGQIRLPEFISVQNLAQALGVRYEQFVVRLEELGYEDIFAGKIFNSEISGLIAMEYDMEPVFETSVKEEEERDLKARPEVDAEDKDLLPTRPPVVTIMGHVDHGKTTILDYLRKSSVAAGEAGGITQHIGAFSVPLAASGKTITFLDTPGHAAFLAMRQRGANVTDMVILVVAADDSVKPQTLEAIKHAQAAGVPMIVAVNKCDKDEADVQHVKQDLARHGVEIEDFGGETQVVPVSGKTGLGMTELEENVVTLSEILDHRADTEGLVEGWILEATTKKAGRVATVLVRRGTLRPGSVLVAGRTWARVRSLRNEAGVTVREATPGMPVEVDGWRDQPAAGDEVLQAPSEQKATSVVEYRDEKAEREKTAVDMEAINSARQLELQKRERERKAEQAKMRNPDAEEPAAEDEDTSTTSSSRMEVPFLIKADVSGSAEAVSAYILSVSSPLISPRILSSSVGAVHESEVELAATAQGHIVSFNLPLDEKVRAMAESNGVKVLENNIIYRVLDDVKEVLEAKLPPIVSQRVLGEAEVGAAFEIGLGGRKKVKIAGCKIRNGAVGKGSRVRVMRGEEKVYDGTIASLKNVKKDVNEMRKGSECGMGFEDWEGFEVGDQIQTYEVRSERRTL